MAKKSSEEYLASILKLLDDTLSEGKKNAKKAGVSNVPAGALNVALTADARNIEKMGASLNMLAGAIIPLSKVSESQYEAVAKGINSLVESISKIKFDKGVLDSLKAVVDAFVIVQGVVDKFSGSLVKTFLKYRPLKGFLIGRILGRYYGNIVKGMLSKFVSEIVKLYKEIPWNVKTTAKRSLVLLMMIGTLSRITMGQLLKLYLMGKFLDAEKGKNIADFFTKLIEGFSNKKTSTKVNTAVKVGFATAALIGVLTLSLIALVILFKKYRWQELLGGGLLLLAVIGIALALVKILGSDKFKKSAIEGMGGALQVALFIGILTLSLVILVMIGAKYNWEAIGKGIVMLVVVVAFALGIIWVLSSDRFQKKAVQGLAGAAGIFILIGGLIISLFITILIGKKFKWEELAKGGLLLVGIVGLALGIMWILSSDKIQKNMLKGLLGMAAVVLLVAALSGAMILFGIFIKQIHEVEWGDIAWAMGITVALIVGVVAAAYALGVAVSNPISGSIFMAGAAAMGVLVTLILGLSKAMLNFGEFIKMVGEMTQEDIDKALNMMTKDGGMIDAIVRIVNALDACSKDSAKKIKAIGKALKPVFESLSMFVDIIQKMATMKVLDHYDDKGNPVYRALKEDEFITAATNITAAFSNFLTKLGEGLKSFDERSLEIIQLLFPRQSGLSKWLTGEKPGIGAVIKVMSDFVDIIIKVASSSVPDQWDENGQPTHYRKLTMEEFAEAGTTITTLFIEFLTKLGEGLRDKVSIKSAIVMKLISACGIQDITAAVANLATPIMQIASGKYAIGNEVVDITTDQMTKAAGDIVDILSTFVSKMNTIDFSSLDHKDIVKTCETFSKVLETFTSMAKSEILNEGFVTKSGFFIKGLTKIVNFLSQKNWLKNAEKGSGHFKDAIDDFSSGLKYLQKYFDDKINTQAFVTKSKNYVKGLTKLCNFLGMIKYLQNAYTGGRYFKDAMDETARGLKSITPYLKATPEQIRDLADALRELDKDLLDKEQQRADAIQSISTNFKDMATNIEYLNTTLTQSLSLIESYNNLRDSVGKRVVQTGVDAVVEATEQVRDTVADAVNKASGGGDAFGNAQMLGDVIAHAVVNAIDQWATERKELTVEFSDSPHIFSAITQYQ